MLVLPRMQSSPIGAALLRFSVLAGCAAGLGNPSCWTTGVSFESCCPSSFGPKGNPTCWDETYTFDLCCGLPMRELPSSFHADCIETNTVLRHAGEHALFADMSSHGHKGCFQNDCGMTDKFNAQDRGVCARMCAELEECSHWSFGEQDGQAKCFLRKSDGGREEMKFFSSGAKTCTPPRLPWAYAALMVAECEGLTACDKGKNPDTCPDVLAATTTWSLAIEYMRRAAEGRVDEGTYGHVLQIKGDTQNVANRVTGDFRPSDADFPRVVYNNRLIFNNLRSWLDSHPKAEFSSEDASLPNPLRFGKLCGKKSCYEF